MEGSSTSAKLPGWFSQALPESIPIFTYFHELRERYVKDLESGHTYKHVMQGQLNAVSDELIASGDLDLAAGQCRNDVVLPKQHLSAVLYNNGASYRALLLLKSAKKAAIVHLIDCAMFGLDRGSLLVAMIAFRGIIEHVAHVDDIIDTLRPYPVVKTFEEANPLSDEIRCEIFKRLYATKVNWDSLLQCDINEKLQERKGLAYQKTDNRLDKEVKQSILTHIDKLSKKVKGTRGVYEVLCEFAHPNVATILSIMETSVPVLDKKGFVWIRNHYGLDRPVAAVEAMQAPLTKVLATIQGCLRHFETLLLETDTQCVKVQHMAQILLRSTIRKNWDLVDPYAECPCASGLKTKFCCGATMQ